MQLGDDIFFQTINWKMIDLIKWKISLNEEIEIPKP